MTSSRKVTQDEYLKRHRKLLNIYHNQAVIYWYMHNLLQFAILLGAASVPFILNISAIPKLVPTIISGLVAVASSLIVYFKYIDRSRDLFMTRVAMKTEFDHYDLGNGSYKDLDSEQAFDLLMQRLEKLEWSLNERMYTFEKSIAERPQDS